MSGVPWINRHFQEGQAGTARREIAFSAGQQGSSSPLLSAGKICLCWVPQYGRLFHVIPRERIRGNGHKLQQEMAFNGIRAVVL